VRRRLHRLILRRRAHRLALARERAEVDRWLNNARRAFEGRRVYADEVDQ